MSNIDNLSYVEILLYVNLLNRDRTVSIILDEKLYTIFLRADGDFEYSTYTHTFDNDFVGIDGGFYEGNAYDAIKFILEN